MRARQTGKLKALGTALYLLPPTAEERAFWGLTLEEWEEEQEEVLVWPEHEQAYRLFRGVETQWRDSINGKTGLDYNVLYRDIDREDVTNKRFSELRDEIKAIEIAALNEMRKEA